MEKSGNEIINLTVKNPEHLKQIEIMQQLVSLKGFHNFWFEQLAVPENQNKSKSEIFEIVNDIYRKVFKKDKGKYSSYNSFMIVVRNNRKSKF